MSFTTIVAPEQVRQQFTFLRDKLKATDKLLMQACWDMVQELLFTSIDEGQLADRIDKLRADQKAVRDAAKPQKVAAKAPKKEKAPKAKKEKEVPSKPAAKKSKKKLLKEAAKAPVVLNEGERIIDGDDDVPIFVSIN